MAPFKSVKETVVADAIEVSKQAQDLRQKFFDWYDPNSNEFHETDVKRLRDDEFYSQRFIHHRKALDNDIDRAFDMIKHVFKWRKEFGVHDMKESDFTDDFLKSESLYPYRRDKEGNVTLMFRVCKHHKDSKKAEMQRRYIVYMLEKIEKKYNGRQQVVFLFDCSGAGISNIDLDLTFFIQTTCLKNYPLILAYVLVFNMPWLFNAAWKIIKSWLPQKAVERIVFVSSKEINNYVDAEDLPQYMGGQDKTEYPLEDKDPISNLPDSLIAVSQSLATT